MRRIFVLNTSQVYEYKISYFVYIKYKIAYFVFLPMKMEKYETKKNVCSVNRCISNCMV